MPYATICGPPTICKSVKGDKLPPRPVDSRERRWVGRGTTRKWITLKQDNNDNIQLKFLNHCQLSILIDIFTILFRLLCPEINDYHS